MFRKMFILIGLMAMAIWFATLTMSQADKGQLVQPKQQGDKAAIVIEEPQETVKQVDPRENDLYAQVELFSYALTTVQSEYVDQKTPKEIIYGSLTGMLGSLDPHSQFLTPEDLKDLRTETSGKFGGLGIEISIRDSLLTVVTPIEDTPAWKAGLKAGDRIVKIENDLTRDMTLNQAVKKLRGEPGTKVHITVLRESEGKVLDFDIIREIIRIQDVKDPHIVEDNIAYVRLVEFRENSAKQIRDELKKLKDQGATALILDLRNNPGGLLNIAIDITEMFLPKGETIVSTRGRNPAQDLISVSKNVRNEFSDWPMIVLINEGSASGSEILAGALKDNKRAVILGTKSFGKGSVQSVIPMPDGSGLRLTTSKYFTPSGVCIHDIGIVPDIVVERNKISLEDELLEEKDKVDNKNGKVQDPKKVFEDIEFQEIKDPNEIEKRKKETLLKKRIAMDNQLQSAISVIKGIRVYKKLQENPVIHEASKS